MPITFRIRLNQAGQWVPDHPELPGYLYVQNETPEAQVRTDMFAAVDEAHPGVYTLDHDLEELRGDVLSRVDKRSDELLQSFAFDGLVFSLSEKAQIRYEYMDRNADVLSYPLPINSRDDRDMLVLIDAAQTRAFCKASVERVFEVVGSGTMEKNKIRSAATVEDLLAYQDPR